MSDHTYTAFVQWGEKDGGHQEQIDVVAPNLEAAQTKALADLESDYLPGGTIIAWIERPDGFLFF